MNKLVYVVAPRFSHYTFYIDQEIRSKGHDRNIRFTYVHSPERLHGVRNSEIRILGTFDDWNMPFRHAMRWWEELRILEEVGDCKITWGITT